LSFFGKWNWSETHVNAQGFHGALAICALVMPVFKAGIAMVPRIAMIETTVRSSMRENPEDLPVVTIGVFFLVRFDSFPIHSSGL